jgi:hypothetical protein
MQKFKEKYLVFVEAHEPDGHHWYDRDDANFAPRHFSISLILWFKKCRCVDVGCRGGELVSKLSCKIM